MVPISSSGYCWSFLFSSWLASLTRACLIALMKHLKRCQAVAPYCLLEIVFCGCAPFRISHKSYAVSQVRLQLHGRFFERCHTSKHILHVLPNLILLHQISVSGLFQQLLVCFYCSQVLDDLRRKAVNKIILCISLYRTSFLLFLSGYGICTHLPTIG